MIKSIKLYVLSMLEDVGFFDDDFLDDDFLDVDYLVN